MPSRIDAGNARTIDRLKAQVEALDQSDTPKAVEDTRALGKSLWATDLVLADLDLSDSVRSFAKMLTPKLGDQLIDAYFDGGGDSHSLKMLGLHLRKKSVDTGKQHLEVDPNLGFNNVPFVLHGAFLTQQSERIELHFERGATISETDGAEKASDKNVSPTKLEWLKSELSARHNGIKDVDVMYGRVHVTVGNQLDVAYQPSIAKLVKRFVADVPVTVKVQLEAEPPLAEMINGIEVSNRADGKRTCTLFPAQSEAMTDRFADLGVISVTSWPNDGCFVHVPDDTTPKQAEKIRDAVAEHVPSDFIAVYTGRPAKNGEPPMYVAPDDVIAGGDDFSTNRDGWLSLPSDRAKKDCYEGLRDGD